MKRVNILILIILLVMSFTGCTQRSDESLYNVYQEISKQLNDKEELTKEDVEKLIKEYEVIEDYVSNEHATKNHAVKNDNEILEIVYEPVIAIYYRVKDGQTEKISSYMHSEEVEGSGSFTLNTDDIKEQQNIIAKDGYEKSKIIEVYEDLSSDMKSNKEVSIEDISKILGKDEYYKEDYIPIENEGMLKTGTYSFLQDNEALFIHYVRGTDKIYKLEYYGESDRYFSIINEATINKPNDLKISLNYTNKDLKEQDNLIK